MKNFGDFFRRIRVDKKDSDIVTTQNNNREDIEIVIEGDVGIFKNEKEQIMQGAKQLLAIGSVKNMEEAVVTFAVMFRGLKFAEKKKLEDGKVIVILRETATKENNLDTRIDDR